jgi:hypothetical protein
MKLLACATQGSGSEDEKRLRALVSGFDATFFEFSRSSKRTSALKLLAELRSRRFDLFILEGTGFAGGLAAILGRRLWGVPYVFSSGDAVAPFLTAQLPLGAPLFSWYERSLCKHASGFIGWTPYLVGRALTYGTPRAITVPGWAPHADRPGVKEAGQAIRRSFKIPDDAVVFGLAGSLVWSSRFAYCYGAELVRAARLAGDKAYVLILGDGSGLDKLKELAGPALGVNIFLPGRVSREEVPAYLAAIDVGSIPQSVDGVGNFRYTTKISEYKAAGLPFITNQIPMAYDLDDGGIFRLPGSSPWDTVFLNALAELMQRLTLGEIAEKLSGVQPGGEFDKDRQLARTRDFLHDVFAAEASSRP